jgi:hypothetical protein
VTDQPPQADAAGRAAALDRRGHHAIQAAGHDNRVPLREKAADLARCRALALARVGGSDDRNVTARAGHHTSMTIGTSIGRRR